MKSCDKSYLLMEKLKVVMSREDLDLESLKKGFSAELERSR